MTKASSHVLVTGMAWTTALGSDLDAVWQRLLAGETGLADVPAPGRLRNSLAAMVASVGPDLPPAERLARLATDAAQRALASSGRASADAGMALVVGTSLGSFFEDDPPRPTAHEWADAVGRVLGTSGTPVVPSTACSAGSDAIVVGAELIRAGAAHSCLCGGVDILTWSKRVCHSALGTLTPTMLRAFDVRHDGTLFGEGAAFVVLEGTGTERRSLARLCGTGSSSDAVGMTAPDTTGVAVRYAMERSLADAGLTPADIGVINAHGSGTPLNDLTEQKALGMVFAGHGRPVVFGTKGNFGHTLGATGAIEAIALILALRKGEVPPVVGLEQPDPEFPVPLARGQPVRCDARAGMSLTLGFGGFDTSLVFAVCP